MTLHVLRNCLTTGDNICDTPANPIYGSTPIGGCSPSNLFDFSLFDDDNCLVPYIDEYTYPNGATFENINSYNYMSYLNSGCRDQFTDGQVMRMKNWINNNLQDVITDTPHIFDADPNIVGITSWSTDKVFDRDIIVEGELSISNCNITFTPTHGFVIKDYGRLTASNVSFDVYQGQGCQLGLQWSGFKVSRISFLQLTNNCSVSNAKIAISPVNNSLGDAHVSFENTSFYNNSQFLRSINSLLYCELINSEVIIDPAIRDKPAETQIEIVNNGAINFMGSKIINNILDEMQFSPKYAFNLFKAHTHIGEGLNGERSEINGFTNGFISTEQNFSNSTLKLEYLDIKNCEINIDISNRNNVTIKQCNVDVIGGNQFDSSSTLKVQNCNSVSFRNNTVKHVSGERSYGLHLQEISEIYNDISNNEFEGHFYSIYSQGDHGTMLEGMEFNCNNTLSLFEASNGPQSFSMRWKGDVGPWQGRPSTASGNIFPTNQNASTFDISYSGNLEVWFYYDQWDMDSKPDFVGSGPYQTIEASNPNCGEIGSNFNIPDPDVFTFDSPFIKPYNDVVFDINSIIKFLLEQGDNDNIINLITNQSSTNPKTVLEAIQKISPFLSVEAGRALLQQSPYFHESEIVQILSLNPDILRDNLIGEVVFGTKSFTNENKNLLHESFIKGTERTNYHSQLIELIKVKHQIINEAINYANQKAEIDPSEINNWTKKRANYKSYLALMDLSNNPLDQIDELRIEFPHKNLEIDRYITLLQLLEQLRISNRTEDELNEAELKTLYQLATTSNDHAAYKARSILRYFYDEAIPRVDIEQNTDLLEFRSLVENRKRVNDIIFTPNPSWGIFNISYPQEVTGTLLLYNSGGKLIITQHSNKKSLNLVDQKSGIYFYKILFDDNTVFNGKLIKL